MNKYKYYFLSDSSKEAIGKIRAFNRKKAIKKAALKKQLGLRQFLKLFGVEEIK
tara:strand:- start:4840 stop:5001 length:162 start_codon:yes stop_codon:yes gene_type:complete